MLFTCLLCAGNVEGSVTVSFDTLYTGPLPPSADIAGQPPPSTWDLIQRVYRLQKHWDRDIMTIIIFIYIVYFWCIFGQSHSCCICAKYDNNNWDMLVSQTLGYAGVTNTGICWCHKHWDIMLVSQTLGYNAGVTNTGI